MFPLKRTMKRSTSCPDGVPHGEPPEAPKDSEEVQLHPPPVPPRAPDASLPTHGMTLRRPPRCGLRSATQGAASPKPGAGNDRPPRPRSAGRGAASGQPPRPRPGAKRRKPYARKLKSLDSGPGPPAAPEGDAPYASRPVPEGLLDSPLKTRLAEGSQRHGSPASSLDPSVVSPLRRLRPKAPQASSSFTPPAKVISKRCASQTTSTPRKGSCGTQPGNSPPSSRPSSPLDQLSQNESQLSSDLSIEFSLPEEELILPFDEEEEEEEELPCFPMHFSKQPASIKEGAFVWCKFRLFPFWPAVVKSVRPKLKKASILWIDQPTIDTKRKGFSVSLRNLKPLDCEDANQLVSAAKANYAAIIDWAFEMINDYVLRIACCSFTGSFIEYSSHCMSYPVRRKYPTDHVERLGLPSQPELEEGEPHSGGEESVSEAPEEEGPGAKRLLPDRTVAAHNRANEKLVAFIVSQRLADRHLLAVVRGQQASRWLCSFLEVRRRLQVKPYLEDDRQLDQVYLYLKELFHRVTDQAPCLANVKFMDDVRFVLDVLLPEAIISAIAGVDNISLTKAEEKYLNGRCISEREREEFELTIGRMR
ncbi:PWWP domain-containing DNA repair factor 3A-like [Gadus chalcogrammus]|uniref:PWWP domain-containing DNA repair factor 3A-like n=1 Tax=Gadus chalcogrammus TaxID=1042646 RepID=UPI0024C48BA3|nr:PWWP domain-containing DNA repair factor 3A-like [Gadus chalcogrammus]XP_056464202.1 PWWP domain-containing DNA repair factor 3A-like [Gadus chalcogrammus]